MKKYFIVVITFVMAITVKAQDVYDALRYGQDNLTGTARFRSMAGAFGALGGDISSINVNPAGSVIANNNQFYFTVSNLTNVNNSLYQNSLNSERSNFFDLNQFGAIFVFKNDQAKVSKLSFGINYENSNNLNNEFFSSGRNAQSIADYFLSYANGIPLGVLGNPINSLNFAQQQAYLGYEGFVINPANNNSANNSVYFSNVPAGINNQSNFLVTEGYNNKITLNLAGQMDNFSFGMNLNGHFVDYFSQQVFSESNNNVTTDGLTSLRFSNDLYTYGSGFSFNLGGIYKFENNLRLGLAYESPTWFRLNEEFTQTLLSRDVLNGIQQERQLNGPINIFLPYNLDKPARYNASAAYVFGNGLISFDYSFRDFANLQFKPQVDFLATNQSMSQQLNGVNEIRVGGEYKIDNVSLRAGYRFEQSPFKSGNNIGDLTNYNAGLGFNLGATKLDLSYSYFTRNTNIPIFNRGFNGRPNIENINHLVALTMLFEF